MNQLQPAKEWLVKAPGEHGKGWRVVHDVGLSITDKNNQPIYAGICEMLTSRSSEYHFSDRKERERAELIVKCVNSHDELLEALEQLVSDIDTGTVPHMTQARKAIAKAKEGQ